MTEIKEQLVQMVPKMPLLIPKLTEEGAEQIYNLFITVKPEQTDRELRAEKRRQLLESEKYVRSSGRTHEEIEAELEEMRSDRF